MAGETFSQALVVLPGITADRAARRYLLDFYRRRSPYRVFYPNFANISASASPPGN